MSAGPTTKDIPIVVVDYLHPIEGWGGRYIFEVEDHGRAGLFVEDRKDVPGCIVDRAVDELRRQEAIWWEAQP